MHRGHSRTSSYSVCLCSNKAKQRTPCPLSPAARTDWSFTCLQLMEPGNAGTSNKIPVATLNLEHSRGNCGINKVTPTVFCTHIKEVMCCNTGYRTDPIARAAKLYAFSPSLTHEVSARMSAITNGTSDGPVLLKWGCFYGNAVTSNMTLLDELCLDTLPGKAAEMTVWQKR